MRILTVAAGCAAIGLFVLSCYNDTVGAPDTSSAGTGGDSAAAIVDNVCQALVAPFCEAWSTCCAMGVAPPFSILDLCKEGHLRSSDNNPPRFCWGDESRKQLEADLRAGTVVFDQAQFDTCLSTLKALSAGGAACTKPAEDVLDTICLSAFRGQIAPGEACAWEDKYLSDNFVPCKDGRCENGKCVPFLKPGDSCDPRNPIRAAANTVCNYGREEGCKVSPPPDAGGAGDGGGAEVMGVCGPKGDIGDACYGGDAPQGWRQCKSAACDATSTCILPSPLGSACSEGL
jgi:hypothetical protein